MEFRRDINGLRAIAVMAVVFFHFGFSGFKGGFVGVDVFFVISGFLMTGIIFKKIDSFKFSFGGFYFDRARRIIPALAVVCLALVTFGFVFLDPSEYSLLGKHVGSSLVFLSNITFWREGGYFDQASHSKWLLHTWSLSVEWQFYMLYPVLLVLLRKFLAKNAVRWFVAVFALLSFFLSVYASSRYQGASFYLLPTRAWEMFAGALVFLFPVSFSKGWRIFLEALGLGLIVFSVIFFSESDVWPGWLAFVPVLGAALVIWAGRNDSVATCNVVSQFLGRASYSIYLWHWPLVVALVYFGVENRLPWVVFAIGVSVALGYLSFIFVEQLASKKSMVAGKWAAPAKVFCVPAIAAVCSMIIFMSGGLSWRASETFEKQLNELEMPLASNGWCFYNVDSAKSLSIGSKGLTCELGDKRGLAKGLLFGDSYAGHYDPFWDSVASDSSIKVNSVATNWCYPAISDEFTGPKSSRAYKQCLINREYLKSKISDYDFVVFAGNWGAVNEQGKMNSLLSAIDFASKNSQLVVLMAAPIRFDVDVGLMYRRAIFSGVEFEIEKLGRKKDVSTTEANFQLEEYARKYRNILYFNRESLFGVEGAHTGLAKDGVPYSLDGSHISIHGSKMSAWLFKESKQYALFMAKVGELKESHVFGEVAQKP
ncbi:acyltransferase family protein [Pseudomonas tussilaginis]|uniref:acyltransferase family protein n=1 Tax=Pseudomonas putida TaxID=303 RepID=UPI0023638DD2|nr:acyltransferase family protein [Pseudomonas putida]MDD1976834.1 acyltransferase [Pseudomonas putida]